MPLTLIDNLATTEALADAFSDQRVLQATLDFEAALARAEAKVGVIPTDAAEAISQAAVAKGLDCGALAAEAQRAGTLAIPVVKALTERVRSTNPDAARFVHWGATSQDVVDTALVLLLRHARTILASDHKRLVTALATLVHEHEHTVMLGRTLLQAAPPVTFGLKAAGWLAAIRRGWERVQTRFAEAEMLQFGGASGTLAALDDQGDAIGRALAQELGLTFPPAPWHTQRDPLAAMIAACGVECGSLGKMARDVALLMQTEVGEAAEPGGDSRGGSSTMPHKRNPIACSLALAAANRVPGLVAAFLSGMVQEHERGAGGWQAEWPIVVSTVQALGIAVASMAEAAEGLTVDTARMRANIEATLGNIFAERVMMLLGLALGRDQAHKLLQQATAQCLQQNRQLMDVLAEMPEITRLIPGEKLRTLDRPEDYLGLAAVFQNRLVPPKE